MTIKIETPDDLNRDFFKSDTSSLIIPEIGLELSQGTMGSFYSTVEGFLEKIINQLSKENPFVGDSSDKEQIKNFEKFIEIMKDCKKGKIPFTMEIDDPLDNCFIYNRHYPNSDPQVKYENYERTHE
jgi:zinc finger protein